MLPDTSEIYGERASIAAEKSKTMTLAAALIQLNALTAMNRNEFNRRHEEYVKRHDALSEKLDKLNGKLEKRKQVIAVLYRLISDMTSVKELSVEFNGELHYSTTYFSEKGGGNIYLADHLDRGGIQRAAIQRALCRVCSARFRNVHR